YAGPKKLARLPRRTAIVAFSADEVYAIAELIRRQQGGAAVVLGALSPRTRNAQVALFQSGDVDYLIATDAIGMGLNLDLDHVAFAQNRKFDGFQYRNLTAAELGQIAGRAGRHLRDGTFGVTGQVDPLDEDLIKKIEGHDFDPVKVLQWRTAHFDFASLDALKRSIETNAPVEGLTRALPAVDAQALEHLSRDEDIRALTTNAKRVALLWEACALPDYRRIAPAQHADLIASIYTDLARHGHVDENYMAEQVRRADTTEGDIDTLSHRIAQIRTWTFVSNRPGWLADQAHWQEKTREIEDRLSDALHERLTKRFVDRRTSVLMRRLRENTMPEAEISPTGTVLVEGHHVGELQGFRFTADQTAGGEDAKAVRTAAQKALAAEFEARAERFGASANGDIALGSDGTLRWIGAPIGTLVSGEDALKPRLVLLADEQLTGPARDKVAARAERFVNFQIESLLKPLVDLKNADQISGIGRGIAFQLVENFGLINRRDIAEEMKSLDQEGRAALRRLGVRFGAYHVFVPALIKPAPAGLVTLLWALKNDGKDKPGFGDVVHALASGRTSVVIDPAFDKTFYKLAGYRNLGRRAVRIDILERLADLIRPATNWKPGLGQRPDGAYDGQSFMVTPPMMSILGATADDMEEILKGLGYRAEPKPAVEVKARLEAQDNAAREAAMAKLAAEEAARAEQTKAADAAAEAAVEGSEPASDAVAVSETATEMTSDAAAEPAAPAVGEQADAPVETVQDEAPVAEAAAEPAPVEPQAEAEAAETEAAAAEEVAPAELVSNAAPATDAAPDEPVTVTEAATGEPAPEAEAPKPILLWRQGRFEQRPRNRDDNRRNNRPRNGQARGRSDAPADAGAPNAAAPGERPAHEGRRDGAGKPRFDRSKFKPKPQAEGEQRRDRPQGERPDRREGRPDWKGGRPDGKGGPQGGKPAFQPKPREERPVRFDPDSPFAKLAALRDQLKK
ncbi:helicase-related protein, partial [Mesorhizobium sp. M7A.F.Ca.CA.002.07.1.1]|uniref:helicase-related protein n=1 Tax=Mesorhizobium sp. M7A.F.Ca.CA.002.07.1.1 TaxID=2496723 RepID=UPI000FD5D195